MNIGEEPIGAGTSADGRPASPAPRNAGPSLLVLAAGMGTRFGGLKQITPVNAAGEAILDYSVYDAMRAGFERVVFVIRAEIEEAFRAGPGARFQGHVETAYAYQELGSLLTVPVPAGRTKPWGTLQATLVGAQQISGPFAVINADDFYGAESYRVLAQHLRKGSGDSAMAGYRLRNTLSEHGSVSRGVCQVDDCGLLRHIDEMKRIVRDGDGAANTADDGTLTALTGNETVSMNMWGFQPSAVPILRNAFQTFLKQHGDNLTAEAYLPEAVNGMVSGRQAEVEVLHTDTAWCGMTYREDYPGVVEHIQRRTRLGEYPEQLWA